MELLLLLLLSLVSLCGPANAQESDQTTTTTTTTLPEQYLSDEPGLGACYDVQLESCGCREDECTESKCNAKEIDAYYWSDTCSISCDPDACPEDVVPDEIFDLVGFVCDSVTSVFPPVGSFCSQEGLESIFGILGIFGGSGEDGDFISNIINTGGEIIGIGTDSSGEDGDTSSDDGISEIIDNIGDIVSGVSASEDGISEIIDTIGDVVSGVSTSEDGTDSSGDDISIGLEEEEEEESGTDNNVFTEENSGDSGGTEEGTDSETTENGDTEDVESDTSNDGSNTPTTEENSGDSGGTEEGTDSETTENGGMEEVESGTDNSGSITAEENSGTDEEEESHTNDNGSNNPTTEENTGGGGAGVEEETGSDTVENGGTEDGEDSTENNLLETLENLGSFSSFLGAVESARLVSVFNLSGPYTLFAPSDAAFRSIADFPSDKNTLTDLLTNHLVPKKLSFNDFKDGAVVGTVAGGSLEVSVSSSGVVMVDGAYVIVADQFASNGVVHVVDKVLRLETDGEGSSTVGTEGVAAASELSFAAKLSPRSIMSIISTAIALVPALVQ